MAARRRPPVVIRALESDTPWLRALRKSRRSSYPEHRLFRNELGPVFVDYYVKLKRTELARYEKFAADNNIDPASDDTTAWEQDEYLDFF